jgi:hypothetical protein
MKTVNLSDPELTVYSGDHLLYELQLFQWTSAAAPSEKKGVTDTKAPTTRQTLAGVPA